MTLELEDMTLDQAYDARFGTVDDLYRERFGTGPINPCRTCADRECEVRDQCRPCYQRDRRVGLGAPPDPRHRVAPPRRDVSWMSEALCAGADTAIFFPETSWWTRNSDALAICDRCPVRDACLEYALDVGELRFGIWGGLLPIERRRLDYQRRNPS